MKKRGFIFKITLIILATLFIVAFYSCSSENSLSLCNIKLAIEDNSRLLSSSIDFKTDLSECELYYSTVYKGTGSSYYGVVSNAEYDSNTGIILSQGLWEINCEWKDPATKETIATGTTGDVWVNLNTSSFLVHINLEGNGSAKLSYKVMCSDSSISSVKITISLSKWSGSEFNTVDTSIPSVFTITSNLDDLSLTINDLNQGSYKLIINVFGSEDMNDSSLLFSDVLGFVVRGGLCTSIFGQCNVKKGQVGGSIYLPPTVVEPESPPSSILVDVGSGNNEVALNKKDVIEDGKIYVVNPDTNSESMNLGHITDNQGNTDTSAARISSPSENSVIGINLNGTNVTMSTANKGYFGQGDYYSENALVIALENKSVMTVYNKTKEDSTAKDATWALINGTRRFQTNTILKDGQLNIVGKNASEKISNAGVIFLGPTCKNNETVVSLGVTEAGDGSYIKQGAINLESDSNHDGGSVILDGDVIVKAVTGISSWNSLTASHNNWPSYTYSHDSTIDGTLNTDISIINGAKIEAQGDTTSGVNKDVATGIYILGNNQEGSINILLDGGSIIASDSSDENETGIRIHDFKGSINITLINGSTISSGGKAIKLYNCTGAVTISVEEGCVIDAVTDISNTVVNTNGKETTTTYTFAKDTNKKVLNNTVQQYNSQ